VAVLEVEVCIPIIFPAELIAGDGKLTEQGELTLSALGKAIDAYLRRANSGARRVLAETGATYQPDAWRTRFPGFMGDELAISVEADDDEDESALD